MAFTQPELIIPEETVGPSDARAHLGAFIDWVSKFFRAIRDETQTPGASLNYLFASEISYLSPALQEMESNGVFNQVETTVRNMPVETVQSRGLFGPKLRWEFSNINRWLREFIAQPTSRFLEWLLDAIESLLDSILEGVPFGEWIKELKEAIKNSLNRNDVD